jgi:hypothetical protein
VYSWRDVARPIIEKVLRENLHSSEPVLKKAFYGNYIHESLTLSEQGD